MVTTTQTQIGSDSGTVFGVDVGLTAELPTTATGSFDFNADVTIGNASQDINIALIIDISASTRLSSGVSLDGDSIDETFLEAQKIAAKELFQSLIDAGYPPEQVTVTLIQFGSSSSWQGEFNLDEQETFEIKLDRMNAESLATQAFTDFEAPLDNLLYTWQLTTEDGVPDDNPESEVTRDDINRVIFMSDGNDTQNNDLSDELQALEDEFNVSITAIGIGPNADPDDLNQIDSTGTAQILLDISQLPDVLQSAPLPDLQKVQVLVDGLVVLEIPAGDPRLVETTVGYRIDCEDVTGYPFAPGDTLNVEVRAIFTQGEDGEILSVSGLLVSVIPCFVAGTRVLTAEGYRAVEQLKVGDRVVTLDHGMQPIRWIGSTTLSKKALERRPSLRPVRIQAHAFGHGQPQRDLRVSQQHRILMRGWQTEIFFGNADGVLTPACSLVNDTSVYAEDPSDVEYVHMAFDQHEVVYSEGLETESFHPCAETVAGMSEAQRSELVAIFPELAFGQAYPAGHTIIRRRDGEILAVGADLERGKVSAGARRSSVSMPGLSEGYFSYRMHQHF